MRGKMEEKKELLEMKVYTKTGDDGTTSLFSGKRVPKHNIRIKTYGTVDELNSWIGLIRDHAGTDIYKQLIEIQHHLMILGSQLATDRGELPIKKINGDEVSFLEESIDEMTRSLPDLKNFIIPGGHPLVSYTHLARSVCRRAERHICELKEVDDIAIEILFYVNRLSDYLFTLARKFTKDLKVVEIKWKPQRK